MNSWRVKLVLIAMAVVIFIGVAPTPNQIRMIEGFNLGALIDLAAQTTPYLLLATTFLRVTTPIRLNRIAASLLLIPTIVLGVPLALFGPHPMSPIHGGVLLACAVAAIIVLVAAPRWFLRTGLYTSFALAFAGSLWSLAAMGSAAYHAASLSDGRPYCLAAHGRKADPVGSYAELRGFRFYTTNFHLKNNWKYYFHGVLIVGGPDPERYNWSPRRLRFDLITFETLHIPMIGSCEPTENFLGTLPYIQRPIFS